MLKDPTNITNIIKKNSVINNEEIENNKNIYNNYDGNETHSRTIIHDSPNKTCNNNSKSNIQSIVRLTFK